MVWEYHDTQGHVISLWDRAMLWKRFIIETINDQLKNIPYIEHSVYRTLKTSQHERLYAQSTR